MNLYQNTHCGSAKGFYNYAYRWGENMGLAQGSPALAEASPTEKVCPIWLNQYCTSGYIMRSQGKTLFVTSTDV